jgi:signal transduction histidine kinase/CheY-like chemotaxis protein/AraC-like DNA-binding protein
MKNKTDKYEERIKQLEDELSGFQNAVAELKILNEIAVAAGKASNIDQTLNIIVQKIIKSVEAEQGLIYLITEQKDVFTTFIKQDDTSRLKHSYHISNNITGWVLLHEKPLLIENLSNDKRFKSTEEEKRDIRTVLCSPVWFEGKIIGIILMINKKNKKSFSENELTLLSIIAVQAGQLIKNSELQQLNFEKKREAEIARLEMEKLQGLDRIKTNFFTNLSHEFRTPLTLILGPLEKIMDQKNYNEDQLKLIYKNANRLLRLINQLLDLTSIDAGKMKLNVEKGDAIIFIKGIAASFQPLAEIKNINLMFVSEHDSLNSFFDRDKLEKILSNLFINAIKFTSSGNIIISIPDKFSFRNNNRFFEINVEDTGVGIPADKIETVFDRFFTESNDTVQTGTGIGLALVRELVELHHGFISVESKLNKGTKFKIEFPLDEKFYNELGIEVSSSMDDSINSKNEVPAGDSDSEAKEEILSRKAPPLILIVEDNEDMRKFIKESIGQDLRILESSNGYDGFEIAINNIPDLVISDVLMPEMNGIELCEKLKVDERTSHIPVILLTARSATENKVEGLETGADDYITKPFSTAELQARINNLIKQRKNLRKQYRKEIIFDPKDMAVTSMDEKFLIKAFGIIEQHISDYKFTVEGFAKEIGYSRMQLHRKIHALTDQSANELIRSYRLKKAARLLVKKSGNISEVAYEVGFNNPSYFASSFKNLFGYSPSEYLQNLNSIQEP